MFIIVSPFYIKLMYVICERGWNHARPEKQGICIRITATCSQELFQLTKWLLHHEPLPTVLLIVGTSWVRGAVGTDNHNHFPLPER